MEAPVAFEARLPPLQPKVSAKLTMLAAANGSLFAGPAVNGGLLQWGRAEGNMRRPTDVQEEAKQAGKVGMPTGSPRFQHGWQGQARVILSGYRCPCAGHQLPSCCCGCSPQHRLGCQHLPAGALLACRHPARTMPAPCPLHPCPLLQPGRNGLARLMSDMMVTHVVERDAPTEDPDAAPAVEVAATDKQRPAACLLVDEPAGLLWVADKEGWVYGEQREEACQGAGQ